MAISYLEEERFLRHNNELVVLVISASVCSDLLPDFLDVSELRSSCCALFALLCYYSVSALVIVRLAQETS